MHTCFCDTYIWYKILYCEYCANNCPLWFLHCNGCDACCSAGARPPTLRRAAIAGGDCDHPKAQCRKIPGHFLIVSERLSRSCKHEEEGFPQAIPSSFASF